MSVLVESALVEDLQTRDLGACNPTLAHQASSTDPGVGLLIPCNVVVRQDDEGNAVVSILDPGAMLKVMRDASRLEGPIGEARERLQRALGKAWKAEVRQVLVSSRSNPILGASTVDNLLDRRAHWGRCCPGSSLVEVSVG